MPQIWLSGRIPSKKNSKRIVVRNGKPRLLSSKDYLSWERGAILEIKAHWKEGKIARCNSITYDFLFPDKRVRDLSNSVEGVNDALVVAGVLVDDKWQVTGSVIMNPKVAESKEDAGVLITFEVAEYE